MLESLACVGWQIRHCIIRTRLLPLNARFLPLCLHPQVLLPQCLQQVVQLLLQMGALERVRLELCSTTILIVTCLECHIIIRIALVRLAVDFSDVNQKRFHRFAQYSEKLHLKYLHAMTLITTINYNDNNKNTNLALEMAVASSLATSILLTWLSTEHSNLRPNAAWRSNDVDRSTAVSRCSIPDCNDGNVHCKLYYPLQWCAVPRTVGIFIIAGMVLVYHLSNDLHFGMWLLFGFTFS